MKKQDTLENQAKIVFLGVGSNLGFRKKNIEKAKLELAVAKGKKQYDKRATKKSRDWNREKARYIRKSS